jgi:hypothetical protein
MILGIFIGVAFVIFCMAFNEAINEEGDDHKHE